MASHFIAIKYRSPKHIRNASYMKTDWKIKTSIGVLVSQKVEIPWFIVNILRYGRERMGFMDEIGGFIYGSIYICLHSPSPCILLTICDFHDIFSVAIV